jgi:glycosyltransferase involved in cell wall biosynthesis
MNDAPFSSAFLRPVVSIVIPCYNYGEFLKDAVDSVYRQTFLSYEIIIVDDGSTDPATQEVLRTYEEKSAEKSRLRVLRKENGGLPAALNTGIRAARGLYICCLDADDTLEPTYLEKTLILLETAADSGFAYSWLRSFGDRRYIWRTKPLDPYDLPHKNCSYSAALYRRADWEKAGGYAEDMRGGYEDWEFWIRLMRLGARGYAIEESLFNYRRHGRTMLDDAQNRHAELVGEIRKRHIDLYEDKSIIDCVVAGYTHQKKQDPFANLLKWNARPDEGAKAVLFLLKDLTAPEDAARLRETAASYAAAGAMPVVATLGGALAYEADEMEAVRQVVRAIYHLPALMPETLWPAFIDYLVQTRGVHALLQSEKDLLPAAQAKAYVEKNGLSLEIWALRGAKEGAA